MVIGHGVAHGLKRAEYEAALFMFGTLLLG
jgi:hypothetical protein